MKPLHVKICNIIEDRDDLTFIKVAELIGCPKQGMSRFKKDGTISFRCLLKLSHLLFPDNAEEVISKWCLQLSSVESIKQSFEFASITRNKPLLNTLINSYKNETGVISNYVSVYSILYKFYTNELSANDLINELSKVGNLKDEIYILSEIIKCYTYYYQEKFPLMIQTAHDIFKLIDKLSERQRFIKECYVHRIAEILGNVSLFSNDLKSTKFFASLIINANICAKTVSDAYYLLGMAFLVEDKHQCIEHLQTRYDITKTLGEEDIEENARRDLDLAKIYLGVKLDPDSDERLIAFQNGMGNEFEIKKMLSAFFLQGDDDLLLLLCAVAKDSSKSLHDCYSKFFSKTNYYFASLTAVELKKRGETSPLIDTLINLKIDTRGDVEVEESYISSFNSNTTIYGSASA